MDFARIRHLQTDDSAGGVLLVESDPSVSERIERQASRIDTQVRAVHSIAEGLATLSESVVPDVLVLDADLIGAASFCRWIRTTPRVSSIYIIAIQRNAVASPARKLHRHADSVIVLEPDLQVLTETMRAGLRARAHYRAARRRARREGLAWLANVVAHEINNPLASAVANIEFLRDALADGNADSTEVRAMVLEVALSLDRIRSAAARLQCGSIQTEAEPIPVEIGQLERDISDVVGVPIRVEVDSEGLRDRVFDAGLLLDTVRGIVGAVGMQPGVQSEVLLTTDDQAVIVLLDFVGSLVGEPASLLEPALTSGPGSGGVYDPRLTWLESRFDQVGGQVLASRRRDRWRFGLVLPLRQATNTGTDPANAYL